MGGCVTGYVAVSGNNGRNPNEDGKTWYVWALTLNTHTATAVAEWVHGRSPVALFWKPPSRWNVCNNAVTNLCLLIIRKLLHFLTNRCIREPYVQWCERLSPSAKAGGAVYSRFSQTIMYLHWHKAKAVVVDKGMGVTSAMSNRTISIFILIMSPYIKY